MAFADPQVVTINSVAKSMPRVEVGTRRAVYQIGDQTFTLIISHQSSKPGGKERVRSTVRIEQRAIVTDPLTNVADYDTLVYYVVVDRPVYGFTMTQVEQLVAGLNAWLTTANVDKIFGQES